MREFKFRAWDKEEREWIDIKSMGFTEDGSLWYLQAWDENESTLDPPYFEDDLGVKWELMQYTGLKDKNGVEIYEGDIIAQRWNDAYLNIKEIKFGCFEDPVDYFNYDGVGFYAVGNDGEEKGTLSYMVKFADYEVIGNIYEDKELLEAVE